MNATVTEREAVLRERAAFEKGWRGQYDWFDRVRTSNEQQGNNPPTNAWNSGAATTEAARRYPLPKVTRPREVIFQGCTFRWTAGGGLQVRMSDKVWASLDGIAIIESRRAVLADLLANPTEEVDE
jgi:hypothetical protein